MHAFTTVSTGTERVIGYWISFSSLSYYTTRVQLSSVSTTITTLVPPPLSPLLERTWEVVLRTAYPLVIWHTYGVTSGSFLTQVVILDGMVAERTIGSQKDRLIEGITRCTTL